MRARSRNVAADPNNLCGRAIFVAFRSLRGGVAGHATSGEVGFPPLLGSAFSCSFRAAYPRQLRVRQHFLPRLAYNYQGRPFICLLNLFGGRPAWAVCTVPGVAGLLTKTVTRLFRGWEAAWGSL